MAEHPDPNILAAVVDGTLDPGQREPLEAHVAACSVCRALLADVARERPLEPKRAPRAYGWWIAAAAVLVAAAVFVFTRGGHETPAELLAAAVHTLARDEPDLFAEFALLTEEERLAPSPVLQRGGPVLLHPTGKARSPVRFAWRPTTGATGYVVSLTKADGTPVWEQTTADPRLEQILPAGRYLWTVSTQGPEKEEASRHFAVAGAQEIADLDLALQRIDETAAPVVRELLRAQFCVRLGFYRDAEHWARAAVEKLPDDPVATQTLYHVLNWIGSPEAARMMQDQT